MPPDSANAMSFDRIGVVVARGTKTEIAAARAVPGVTYLEGNQPIEFTQETSNTATRGDEAFRTLTGADGSALSGAGVSVGVIDSGVDPTHPYLTEADGSSVVVSNNKELCDPFAAACARYTYCGSADGFDGSASVTRRRAVTQRRGTCAYTRSASASTATSRRCARARRTWARCSWFRCSRGTTSSG